MSPAAPVKKSAELVVKEHARELFNQAVSDLRTTMLTATFKGEKVNPSEQQFRELYQGFADKSLIAANIFRQTWIRQKGAMFPTDK